jgi:hypothetical protein
VPLAGAQDERVARRGHSGAVGEPVSIWQSVQWQMLTCAGSTMASW